jgi:hypothetical protein
MFIDLTKEHKKFLIEATEVKVRSLKAWIRNSDVIADHVNKQLKTFELLLFRLKNAK